MQNSELTHMFQIAHEWEARAHATSLCSHWECTMKDRHQQHRPRLCRRSDAGGMMRPSCIVSTYTHTHTTNRLCFEFMRFSACLSLSVVCACCVFGITMCTNMRHHICTHFTQHMFASEIGRMVRPDTARCCLWLVTTITRLSMH